MRRILHSFGFHHWGLWKDYIIAYGIVYSQTRTCLICNKRQEQNVYPLTVLGEQDS